MDNIRDKFVGEIIELIAIDATPLIPGEPIIRFTNNKPGINWDGNFYQFTPCEVSGVASTAAGALNKPNLTVSNIERLLMPVLMQSPALVGAIVTRVRTWFKYTEDGDDTDPLERYPPESWKISNTVIDRSGISFSLINELDSPESQLSRIVMLRDEFPGLRDY